MWKAIFAVAVFIAAAVAPFPAAQAAQQLIPAPYPEGVGSTGQLGGGAPPVSRHQHLIPDPVPQSLGPNALGNPEPVRGRRHQHLRRTPYWRQYHHFQ
ncbi:conserved exported hypothetical protein [Methylocella tundrae]|uniref:Uncharacterized protein n=1 Tax=Methylocella tundrae TaxID=227605 RepID=A0A8B6M1D7_METTU|nr:hypothetical protein [Methylocella tundrae]VTZ26469.1 conserved exported hypothetical protein [Methylocella tundrae]VTZ48544.1 conserved exported hypothetical protein [Methylocella tundrae]